MLPNLKWKRGIYPLVFLALTGGFIFTIKGRTKRGYRGYRSPIPDLPTIWSVDDGVGVGNLPLTSFVVVFTGASWPVSFQYFIDSVAAQPETVAVTIIQKGIYCSDLSALIQHVPNVKHVCLSERKFWRMHRDYLCDKWGGCEEQDSEQVLKDMIQLGKIWEPQAWYPLLRGFVFWPLVHPRARYWGWCDIDTIFGNFEQTFPYDIAKDFDVMTPSDTNNYHNVSHMVFLRGHMTIWSNRASTERKVLKYDPISSMEGWNRQNVTRTTDEGIISWFVVNEPEMNFLQWDGMNGYNPIRSSSIAGSLRIDDSWVIGDKNELKPEVLQALLEPVHWKRGPTFTRGGIEKEVEMHSGYRSPDWGVWFHEDYANWYQSDHWPGDGWDRYLMKKDNRWTLRAEPTDYIPDGPLAGTPTYLYTHFHSEKGEEHFKLLAGLPRADLLIYDTEKGVAGWNFGHDERSFWLYKHPERDCLEEHCVPASYVEPPRPPPGPDWPDHWAMRHQFIADRNKRLGRNDSYVG